MLFVGNITSPRRTISGIMLVGFLLIEACNGFLFGAAYSQGALLSTKRSLRTAIHERKASNESGGETSLVHDDWVTMESVALPRRRVTSNSTRDDIITTENDASSWEQGAVVFRQEDDNVKELSNRRNVGVAIASVLFAVFNYAWQLLHPITPIQLLTEMQSTSTSVVEIGRNGKPTVVDFWAPWCENCKLAAPTLHKVEELYNKDVNFVMINGDLAQSWPYIERFGVDAIPHLALVSESGEVETALIGPIPKSVLEADLNTLISNSKTQTKEPLPYQMLDVFANRPQDRRVSFDE